ncbi:MAG: sulfonate transport system substrate-binding protein [Patiriisocius sp.]|jgi:sulfonate transport system substrate-binding protein
MKKIKVGGVPEHFNLPWHLAIEGGKFAEHGFDVEWVTFKGGTGAMTKALRDGEVDVCVLLTEGIITDISNGNPSKIISQYIKTPLIWGVHTSTKNDLEQHKNIFDRKFAISRNGSGSHLMPIVDAQSKGKEIKDDQFKIIKNLDNALVSLDALETDVFYWEKFTTKPYVDNGQLKKIGEFITPWPCFVIAATDKIIESEPETLVEILRTIHNQTAAFMDDSQAIYNVSERYNLKYDDVEHWFHSTEWATDGWVSDKMLQSVLYTLKKTGILPKTDGHVELVWKR